MDDGDLTSLIEGLGPVVLTQQNHYLLSNTYISAADTPFPTPSPSPSILLRSPAAVTPNSPGQARSPIPSPARPNTPQPAILIPANQAPAALINRAQIIQPAGLKNKQPPQILPKPLTPGSTPTKQQRITQQPLIINQAQQQPQQLVLNQVLSHPGAPMLVQPAGGSGPMHFMLRSPAGTQGKVVLGSASSQPVLFQPNRQQVMRIMTAQGPMQLQTVQTASGPQLVAIPANQSLSLPPNSVLVQGTAAGTLQLQPQPQQVQIQPLPQPQSSKSKKNVSNTPTVKKTKAIRARTDSITSPPPPPPSTVEEVLPPKISPKIITSPPVLSVAGQKNVTSSLRQIRAQAITRNRASSPHPSPTKKVATAAPEPKKPISAVDNLTATINSVATNIGPDSPPSSGHSFEDFGESLDKKSNLVKSPGPSQVSSSPKKSKKKGKKEEAKVDLWDLMQSAGIGDEELDPGVGDLSTESVEITADSELLAQLQGSQALQIPGGLRLAVGDDGRPVLIDGNNIIIQDAEAATAEPPVLNLTPQALATAQNQLTQLLQDHGTITPADQQLLNQIFTVNPSQGLTGLGLGSSINQSVPTSVPVTSTVTVPTSSSGGVVSTGTSPPSQQDLAPPPPLPPELPPLGPDSLVIKNDNGVPTLVASPALLEYLQTHQGIIQFQHDPVTKTIQPSLIIPHPSSGSINRPSDVKSPRMQNVSIKDMGGGTDNRVQESGQSSLANIFRNQNISPNVKVKMARMIQENPSLMQVARDTSALITYRETCNSLTEADIAEIDRKIQNNKNILDQCFNNEVEKKNDKENAVFQFTGSSNLHDLDMNAIKGLHSSPGTNSPNSNSDFQNKFLESIGMTGTVPTTVNAANKASSTVNSIPAPAASPAGTPTAGSVSGSPAKKSRKKKVEKVDATSSPTANSPVTVSSPATSQPKKIVQPMGNLTFNIKQLSPEQNERLNIALNARGVTANRVAMCEMTEVEKQIIEEEIRKVTGGTLGNTTVKFFPPPNLQQQQKQETQQAAAQTNTVRYDEEHSEINQSPMVLNNPNLNQLLDGVSSGQIVSIGNQVLQLPSTPPPGSVIVGPNGQVLAFVQPSPSRQPPPVPTIQLTAQKQQMLKSIQAQIQAITSKPTRTQADSANLDKLLLEQQKILQSGKLINTGQQILVNQGSSPGRVIVQQGKTSQAVNTGTSTSDMPAFASLPGPNAGKAGSVVVVADPSVQYAPIYVNSDSQGKNVTKCEKSTSPIQIQMGTQTQGGPDFRSVKMSTGTMTSPNTGKPQAVVAPAVMHVSSESQNVVTHQLPMKQAFRTTQAVVSVSRTALIEKQMLNDQAGACKPDTHTPFLSTSDAVKRLMRYHVMDEKGLSLQDLQAADDMFEATASHLLEKFRVMKEKYKYLLLMESMREASTAERIMVDRNFVIEERMELEELKIKEQREQELFLNPPSPAPVKMEVIPFVKLEPLKLESVDMHLLPESLNNLKTEDSTLTAQALMELEETLESDSDSLSSFGADLPPESMNTDSQTDSTDISAQVQSAIDSILNLRQSGDEDERRKRKRNKTASDSLRKKGRKFGAFCEESDPGLEEAIRSILS